MRLTHWIERAQKSPRLRNNRVVRFTGGWVIRGLLHIAKYQWETKNYEFWTLLMIAMLVVRPRSIVELGTGRSSNYLAEYAGKYGARLACVEQNRWFAKRMRRALRQGLLEDGFVHFVPLAADGWYAQEAIEKIAPPQVEMLVVDGPVGVEEGLGKGSRDGSRARRWIGQAAESVRLLVVDDVERPSQLELFAKLANETRLSPGFLLYPAAYNDGIVGVAMFECDWARVRAAVDAIGIKVYGDFASAQAVAALRAGSGPGVAVR